MFLQSGKYFLDTLLWKLNTTASRFSVQYSYTAFMIKPSHGARSACTVCTICTGN
jgi:hypothetical protein